MKLSRRSFIQSAALATLPFWIGGRALAAEPRRPRGIVLVIADDLGVGDVSCYNASDFKTPHIDALAAEGLLFTDGYACAPVCMPSRCGTLTGRFPASFGVQTNPNEDGTDTMAQGLPIGEKTIADFLKMAGYRTALIGKWHLGETEAQHPLQRGFDEFFGFLGGHTEYEKSGQLLRDKTPVSESGYLTDILTREAIAFIDRNQHQPFFLCVTYNAVHSPMQATEPYLSQVSDSIRDPGRRIAAAMTLALDAGVGALSAKLKNAGLADDSVFLFTSDNGAKTRYKTSNGGLRGEKGTLYEGGIRIPLIAKYPGVWMAGQKSSIPVTHLDLLPTLVGFADNARGFEPNWDGVNWQTLFNGSGTDRPLFWKWGPSSGAVRKGKWKYFKTWSESGLYNLEQDVSEKNNAESTHPQIAGELKALLSSWEKKLPPPKWGPPQWFKKNP